MSDNETFQPVGICEGAPRIGAAPAQAVMELGWAWWASAVIRAAATLGVADAVDAEPVDAETLAQRVGAQPDILVRLMRALIAYGVFRQDDAGRYVHTDASRALRSDAPERLKDIMLTGGSWSWAIWDELAASVRTGESGFQRVYGKDLIRFFIEDDPQAGQLTHRGYSAQAEALNPSLVAALDVTSVSTVVDVGGGRGSLLRAVLQHYEHLHGVLFDSESVLRNPDPRLLEPDLAPRAQLLAGDLFTEMPVRAELYVFRQVLHMWDDDTCVRGMQNIAAAAAPGARVVLFEHLVSDPPENPFDALMDLHMLLVTGGRERSEREYAQLFERAGLRFKGVTSTGTPLRLLEATAAG